MDKDNSKKIPFWELFKTLIIFVVAFTIIIFVAKTIDSLFVEKDAGNQAGTSLTRPAVTCGPDFASYSELTQQSGHVVKLIGERKNMYAAGGKFVNSEVVLAKSETATSKVACGYLFVRAGTTNDGALQKWQNLYINPNGFGGHINPESAVSVNDGEGYSEYLYALNKIQYWPNHSRQEIRTADWAALLNVSETVPFDIAFNGEDKTGFIDEVSIAYKCWNPVTGEENSDCRLEVTSSKDTIK